ncbi:MAG: hypothetical protein HRT36_04390 [Alphaproteobacteria bacterium]|nr:hypothetical protein [Alphaproteobacteria bacterium]
MGLVENYLQSTVDATKATNRPIEDFLQTYDDLVAWIDEVAEETAKTHDQMVADINSFNDSIIEKDSVWKASARDNAGLIAAASKLEPLAKNSSDLIKQIDQLSKLIEKQAKHGGKGREVNKIIKNLDIARKKAVEHLRQVHYIFNQAQWLQYRFPDAELRDVEGLVKLVDHAELADNDWSLTPGRYVGVAPEEEDENFDFEQTLRDIHLELANLNNEAAVLAAQIQKNFEELRI